MTTFSEEFTQDTNLSPREHLKSLVEYTNKGGFESFNREFGIELTKRDVIEYVYVLGFSKMLTEAAEIMLTEGLSVDEKGQYIANIRTKCIPGTEDTLPFSGIQSTMATSFEESLISQIHGLEEQVKDKTSYQILREIYGEEYTNDQLAKLAEGIKVDTLTCPGVVLLTTTDLATQRKLLLESEDDFRQNRAGSFIPKDTKINIGDLYKGRVIILKGQPTEDTITHEYLHYLYDAVVDLEIFAEKKEVIPRRDNRYGADSEYKLFLRGRDELKSYLIEGDFKPTFAPTIPPEDRLAPSGSLDDLRHSQQSKGITIESIIFGPKGESYLEYAIGPTASKLRKDWDLFKRVYRGLGYDLMEKNKELGMLIACSPDFNQMAKFVYLYHQTNNQG